MRISGMVTGIILILLGVLSLVFYEQYWAPKRESEALLREAILIAERDTTESTNEALKKLTFVWAHYQNLPVAKKALLRIGMAYEKLGLNESALEKYRYLSQNGTGLSKSDRNILGQRIAHIQILRNYSDEAVSQLYQLLNKSSDSKFRSQIYTELGMLYYKNRKFKKALNALEIAERENGANRHATLEKAKVLRALGQHDKVFSIYQNFMRYDKDNHPSSKDVVYNFRKEAFSRGYEEYKKRRFWRAIRYFKIVVNRFRGTSHGIKAYYWIGESYFRLGNFKRAISYYSKLREYPASKLVDDATFKMGEAYFELNKFDLAAKQFNDIIVKHPNSNYFNLAREWKEQCENEILHRMKTSQRKNGPSEFGISKGDSGLGNDSFMNEGKNSQSKSFGAANKGKPAPSGALKEPLNPKKDISEL